MNISICIPCLNDQAEVNATIKSIRETSGDRHEIIVVDDQSSPPVILEDAKAILIRNPVRLGPGHSRHIAVEASHGSHVMLIDSHMRFEGGWSHKLERYIPLVDDSTVLCGSMLAMDSRDMVMEEFERPDLFKNLAVGRKVIVDGVHGRKADENTFVVLKDKRPFPISVQPDTEVMVPATDRYYGARLNILGPNPNNASEHQILEGVWTSPEKHDMGYLSCLMGACYVMSRSWYNHIGGLKWNRQWGSEEPNISLKTWLAGGTVRLMKGVRIGHKFHSGNLVYTLATYWPVYNKLRSILTIFSDDEAKFLQQHFAGLPGIQLAAAQIQVDMPEIMADRDYFRSIAKHDAKWFCDRFKMPYFMP